MKADNALPFVPAMTYCEVVHEPHHRVVFTRIAGSVLGTIANEIEEADGELFLRFSFALVVRDVEGGSAEERTHADGVTADYLEAVEATFSAMRKVAVTART